MVGSRSTVKVSANEGVVLGMLARGSGSGYDLVRRIRRSVGYFWTPARSHVYSILPRLVGLGLARAAAVPGEQGPDKVEYELTERGREALVDWLASADLVDGPPRNPFLVKLFFGDVLPADDVVAHVRERRARIEAELAELEAIEPTSMLSRLTLSYGIEVDRAILRWADDALRELEAG